MSDRSGAHTSRTLLVSFLGAIARRMGDWVPIAVTIELMGDLGVDPPSVRTSVFRLKERGWLASESRAGVRGYALTDQALTTLAVGDQVIWHARQPANLDDGWCVVNFSVPESSRARRHKLRAHLASLGFGNIGTAMWIAPARMRDAAERAVRELDLEAHSAIFVGNYVGGRDLSQLLYESWNLDQINDLYRQFIADFAPMDEVVATTHVAPRVAFTTYLQVIDHWRKLPFRDPGLPRELLADNWAAPQAGALFENLVKHLEAPALAYASHVLDGENES